MTINKLKVKQYRLLDCTYRNMFSHMDNYIWHYIEEYVWQQQKYWLQMKNKMATNVHAQEILLTRKYGDILLLQGYKDNETSMECMFRTTDSCRIRHDFLVH